jgi:hypothetical protein
MIPAVDGLLPEPHNTQLLTLLYRLAEWHALAKLRMHTEHTLQRLEEATRTIGHELRTFRDWTRTAFTCKELPRETAARARNKQQKQAQKGTTMSSQSTKSTPAKVKLFNLNTYKLHALGDYVQTIRLFGTTDSYSTQIVRFHSMPSFCTLKTSVGRTCPPHCETPL